MAPTAETLRLLRLTGVFTWLLVAAPQAIEGPAPLPAFAAWLASLALFGALYLWTTSRLSSPDPTFWAALAGQTACVIVMAAIQYRGLEGTLLVLIALQLGLVAPRRVGIVWIGVQSLALMWAIQFHWSLRPALMFAPPYVGFQVLTLLMVELLGREARARTELAKTNAELLATRERLAESARAEERLRIAGELHDAMGHHLAGLSLHLEALAQRQGSSPPLDMARSLTRRLLDDVESLVDTLGRELGGVDLSRALAALTAEIPRPHVHVEAGDLTLANAERAHVLWRCCQEIVTNAVKHADAENLWIAIQARDGQVELTARDDGSGASRVGPGHGLEGMRRRLEDLGGALDLQTRPGAGFRVRVTLPDGTS
jgi:signal transduction histidine kinase